MEVCEICDKCSKMDSLKERVIKLEERADSERERSNRIENKISGQEERIRMLEDGQKIIDKKLDKIQWWIIGTAIAVIFMLVEVLLTKGI